MVSARITPLVSTALGAALAFYSLLALDKNSLGKFQIIFIFLGLLLGAVSILPLDMQKGFRLLSRSVVFFSLGLMLGIAASEYATEKLSLGLNPQRVDQLLGYLDSDVRELDTGSFLAVSRIKEAKSLPISTSSSGKITVFMKNDLGRELSAFGKGSLLSFTGKIKEGRSGPVFTASGAELLQGPPPLQKMRNSLRTEVLRHFKKHSWGSLASALLLAYKDDLESGEQDRYTSAGCAHVLSLSGMHLAVISTLIAFLLKKPLGLKAATIFGALFVCLYTLFVGSQASLLRSCIMYLFGATALLCGYPRQLLPLLAAAFLFQLIIATPSATSLSFMLSYLALAGIGIIGSAFDDLSRAYLPTLIRSPLSASLGAFIATAALCLAAFGQLRPIGLLASLFVVPITSLIMIGSLLWLFLDILIPPLSPILSIPLSFLVKINTSFTTQASKVRAIDTLSMFSVFLLSLALSIFLVYGRKRRNEMRQHIDPFD
ncbi:ComEC/Rec2 family competence protein [Treponema sp.]